MLTGSKKDEALSLDKIMPNKEQRQTIRKDDIKKIAEIIDKNGQVDPVIVRPHGKKFEICKGQDIYEALVYLKKPLAQVIIKNYTSDKGCEIALASLFCYYKLTSIERENHIYIRWKNGNYESYRDLSKVIPLTPERIGYLIYAKPQRIKLFGTNGPLVWVSTKTSTETIVACRSLSIPEQRKFCMLVVKGEISGREVHKEAKFIRSRSEDEKKVLLDLTIPYKDAKYVIEKRFPQTVELLDKAKGKLKEKVTIKKAVQEERIVFTPEVFQKHLDFLRELDPSYIDNIEGETERKQADSDETNAYVLHTRYMLKRGKIDENLFNTILKWFKLVPKMVEYHKMLEETKSRFSNDRCIKVSFDDKPRKTIIEMARKVDEAVAKDPSDYNIYQQTRWEHTSKYAMLDAIAEDNWVAKESVEARCILVEESNLSKVLRFDKDIDKHTKEMMEEIGITERMKEQEDLIQRIERHIRNAGPKGIKRSDLSNKLPLTADEIYKQICTLGLQDKIVIEERKPEGKGRIAEYYIHSSFIH